MPAYHDRTRPLSLKRSSRQTESHASAKLVLPLKSLLLDAYISDFGQRTAEHSLDHPPKVDLQSLLSEHRLSPEQIDIEDLFQPLRPIEHRLPRTRTDLQRLISQASDLAEEQGVWCMTEVFHQVAEETYTEICRPIKSAIFQSQNQGGNQAALSLVSLLQQQFLAIRGLYAERPSRWSVDISRKLRSLAQRTEGFLLPAKPWLQLVAKTWHDLPFRMWLDDRQQTAIERGVQLVNTAAEIRYQQQLIHSIHSILDRLVGDHVNPGFLEDLKQGLENDHHKLASLTTLLPQPLTLAPAGCHELLVVNSLDDLLYQGFTVRDWFDHTAGATGCSPGKLAQRWWCEGLDLNGQLLRPGQWPLQEPSLLAKAMLDSVREHLSMENPQKFVDTNNPRTAYDRLGALGLLSPALRSRLKNVLDIWVARVGPYLEDLPAQPLLGEYHLTCTSADRLLWNRLLRNHCAPRQENVAGQQVTHACVAELTYFGYGCPGQTLPIFHRACQDRLERECRGEAVLPGDQRAGELRLLSERPSSHEDTCKLWSALKKSGAIRKLSSVKDRWALTRVEPSLKHHFYLCSLKPQWQNASQFQSLLNNDLFINFLEVHFTLPENWAKLSLQMADATESRKVADQLVKLHILDRGHNGAYRMSGHPPLSLQGVPHSIYTYSYSQHQGLSEEGYLERLLGNDWFYNVMFWRVSDAWTARRLTRADIPDFVRDFHLNHLHK